MLKVIMPPHSGAVFVSRPEAFLSGDRVAVCEWGGSALKLDQVVSEVKESEEWEGVKMSILSIGIEKGNAEGMI